jgi:hypothetical protein
MVMPGSEIIRPAFDQAVTTPFDPQKSVLFDDQSLRMFDIGESMPMRGTSVSR